jgi:hypothetical protein
MGTWDLRRPSIAVVRKGLRLRREDIVREE